jgi:hypothetical protein
LLIFGGKNSPISPYHKIGGSEKKLKNKTLIGTQQEKVVREKGGEKNNNAQSVLAAHDTNPYYQSLT